MLQWMGGSRRKVTASRKSTQKRQRQYFEQRKRQHQEEAAVIENHADGLVTSDHQKGNRSLDILSLLNVPEVTEECRFPCGDESTSKMINRAPCARSSEDVGSRDHHTFMMSPIVKMTNEVAADDCTNPTGTRTPLSHQVRAVSSMSCGGSSTQTNSAKVRNDDSQYWKNNSSIFNKDPSILDIIGDDGVCNASEGNPGREAHVAFSVQGLGDLGTETPKQSPKQPGRISYGGQPSLTKAAKKLHFHKNLNSMLDDLEKDVERFMEDPEEATHSDHLDSFTLKEDVFNPFSYEDHELPTVKDGNNLGGQRWERNFLHDEDRVGNIWNSGSSFWDDNAVDGKFGVKWKNSDANHSYWWRKESSGFKFEERNFSPSPGENISDGFNILDEREHQYQSMDKPKYSSFMCDSRRQADRLSPYTKMEDTRENLSSFSEESYSSGAVRDASIADMPYATCIRSHCKGPNWLFKSDTNETYQERMQDMMAGAATRQMKYDRFGKCSRSNTSHLRSTYFSQATFNEKSQHEDCWLLDEETLLAKPYSHSDPFVPSAKKNRQPEGDPFSTHAHANLPRSSKCSFGKFQKNTPAERFSENVASFQPISSKQSLNISSFWEAGCGESTSGVHHDFNTHVQSSNSSDVADFFGEMETEFPVPDLSGHGSVIEEVGDKPKSQLPNLDEITQISARNKKFTPESKLTPGETNSKDDVSSCCEAKSNFHQEATTYSSEDEEETSLSVKTQHDSDDELNTKELQGSIPVLCQRKLRVCAGDVGCFMGKPVDDDNPIPKGPEVETMDNKPSCQLMTVESYVLQLFCVSGKAAVWDAAKKIF